MRSALTKVPAARVPSACGRHSNASADCMLSRRELICCAQQTRFTLSECAVCEARGVSGDLVARRVGHPTVVVIVPLELDPVVLRPLGVQWRGKGELSFCEAERGFAKVFSLHFNSNWVE